MAKVEITIQDNPDGTVRIAFKPTIKEMQRVATLDSNMMTMSHCYAAAAAKAFLETSNKNDRLKEQTDGESSRIIIPVFGKS